MDTWLVEVTAVSPPTGERFPADSALRDGRIAAITPPGTGSPPAGARVIDGGGPRDAAHARGRRAGRGDGLHGWYGTIAA